MIVTVLANIQRFILLVLLQVLVLDHLDVANGLHGALPLCAFPVDAADRTTALGPACPWAHSPVW